MKPETFKAWRGRLGLTQIQTADALGVARSAISRFEAGETTIDKRTRLAMAAIEFRVLDYTDDGIEYALTGQK